MSLTLKQRSVLPGFGLTLGFTVFYLCLIVLIPLSAAFLRSFDLGADEWLRILTNPRVVASFRISFGASLLAAVITAGRQLRVGNQIDGHKIGE